jgi:hypothetical protein
MLMRTKTESWQRKIEKAVQNNLKSESGAKIKYNQQKKAHHLLNESVKTSGNTQKAEPVERAWE